ncbi:hypothetical protein [Brachybacterium phenoliresistens]|uniref:Uncharacterized protein n=1 Tax=Brachybacterium phenoliresistens TaxID=396014 RepID=Z9JUZ7_9MICO|nr:hypothetical protein [Brachybacterium phenoliresistens]EWS81577.1 hypothetical protein BF93_15475 [Brachybacterium phenoliresistens]
MAMATGAASTPSDLVADAPAASPDAAPDAPGLGARAERPGAAAGSGRPAAELPPHLRPHLHADGTVAPVLVTDFDVAEYTRTAPGRLPLDHAALAADPGGLDEADLRRDLAFLHRLQSSALAEARSMLSTWTGNEARITAFLATWLYERHWAAAALAELLEATGPMPAVPASDGAALSARRLGTRARALYAARALPVLAPLWTGTLGENVTAGHMARMAILESSLAAAHRALLPRTRGEARRALEQLLERTGPARRFFRLEAHARLTRSRAEALTARAMLALAGPVWRPVGVADPAEHAALTSILSSPESRAEVRRAHEDVTRLLPGPRPRVPMR